jgi:glycine dehydrogenase subunit 1
MGRFNGDTVKYSEPKLTVESDFAALAEAVDGDTGCVVVQYPDILGRIDDMSALAFSIHLTLLGEKGLRALAAENHRLACLAAERLAKVPGVEVLNESFFLEFTIVVPGVASQLVRDLADGGVLAGVSLGRLYPDGERRENGLVVAVTETVTEEDIEALAPALEEALK